MRPCVLVCVWDRVYSGRTTFTPPPRSITMLPSVPLLLHTHMHTGPNARLGCVCVSFIRVLPLKSACQQQQPRFKGKRWQLFRHTHTPHLARGNTHSKKKGDELWTHTLSLCEFANLWVFDELQNVCVCASVCVLMLCVGCSYASVSHLTSLDISFHMRGNRQIRFQSITNRAGLPHNHTQ